MTDISTLVDDIYKLFEGKELSEHLEHFSNELIELLRRRFKRYAEEDNRKPSLSMSMIGKPLRMLWYDLKGYKDEEPTPQMLFKYTYGDLLECLLVFFAKEAGHKVEFLQEKVELDGVKGRIDLCIDDHLIDIKSASSRSYDKFQERTITESDPFGYIGQLSGYTCALLNSKYPIKGSGFLAVDKQLGKICLCLFSVEEMLAWKPRERIKEIRQAEASDTPPERCFKPVPLTKKDPEGPTVLSVGCSYCSHKFRCWADINGGTGLVAAQYSSGPKYFVDVKNRKFKVDTFPVKQDET